MSEIKSEKVKERIEYYSNDTDFIYPLTKEQIAEVVAIAEQQAEERHAKAMKELKDKAVEAFAAVCKSNFGNDCERCAHGMKGDYCKVLELFTQKLNEQ